MKRRSWVIAFVFGGLVAGLADDGLLGTPARSVRGGYEEIQCDLNGDREPDFVRIYHSRSRNKNGYFDSVAVFLLRRQTYLVPIHIMPYGGQFPGMLWIRPYDLDDDGMSEFVVGESSSGASRSYTRVSVLDIAVPPKEGSATEVRFRHDAENLSPDEVRIEAIGPKGHYRLRIKDTSFHLVNGQDVRKPKPKQAPAEPTATPK